MYVAMQWPAFKILMLKQVSWKYSESQSMLMVLYNDDANNNHDIITAMIDVR